MLDGCKGLCLTWFWVLKPKLDFFFSEDKNSDGKEKKAKSKEKKKEVSTMFQISGDKEAKSKKKGLN